MLKLALIGANGMLAQMVKRVAPKEYRIIPFDLPNFDLTNQEQVFQMLYDLRPEVIINCAAYTHVDGCESDENSAMIVNGEGPGYLAHAAKEIDAVLVHISTDYVFDGEKREPYTEEDPVNPRSVYGRSKLKGEEKILASGLKKFFIFRTSWLYGPGGKNFVETIIRMSKEKVELRVVDDQIGTPSYTGDLAEAIFRLLAFSEHRAPVVNHGLYGLYHFSNSGFCSWHEFAVEIVAQLKTRSKGLRVKRILPIRTVEYPLPAERPAYSVFSKRKYIEATDAVIPFWKDSLVRYFEERGN